VEEKVGAIFGAKAISSTSGNLPSILFYREAENIYL
jgi:hypothetical protein